MRIDAEVALSSAIHHFQTEIRRHWAPPDGDQQQVGLDRLLQLLASETHTAIWVCSTPVERAPTSNAARGFDTVT